MRDVLILGSGRSGTSMVGGTFAHAGWFVGDAPYGPRAANPKGFYESPEINGINEDLLAAAIPASEGLGAWQRWLARLPAGTTCARTPRSDERIARVVRRRPYAYKDPRFAWTLPAWEPFVGDALRVCVFRHPSATAASIEKECRDAQYLHGVAMTRERALALWLAQYQSILDVLSARGEWLYLHYEQALAPEGLARIERAVGAPVARDFPEASLRRSPESGELSDELHAIYAELCARAGHPPPPRARASVGASATRSAAQDSAQIPAQMPAQISAQMPAQIPAQIPPRHSAACAAADAERAAVRAAVRAATTRAGSLDAPELGFARGLTLAVADAYVVERLPRLADLEREVRELSALDARVVASAGIARAVGARLRAAGEELVEVARREGYVQGLLDLGLDGWDALSRAAPWPLATEAAARVLAWPAWEAEELAALLSRAPAALAGLGARSALCLRHDATVDGPLDAALARLADAAARAGTDAPIEVLVVDDPLDAEDVARLGRAVDLWIDLPSSRSDPRARLRRQLGPALADYCARPSDERPSAVDHTPSRRRTARTPSVTDL